MTVLVPYVIEKSGRELFTLVESILFITKLESGRLPPKCSRSTMSVLKPS